MENSNKRSLYITITLIIIFIISFVIGVDIANSLNKMQKESADKKEYYYCYITKNQETTCGNKPCKHTSYYKFNSFNKSNNNKYVNQTLYGLYYSEFKYNEQDFIDAQVSDIIEDNVKYKVDAKNSIFKIEQEITKKSEKDKVFEAKNQVEYLKTQGFNNCEIRHE